MLRPLILAALILPAALAAQDAATATDAVPATDAAPEVAATRPGLEPGAAPPLPSDDLAECAAMMAVVSSRATQRIARERLQIAAGTWFATAGDVALAEGELPAEEVWGQKVADWAGRIGSLDALTRHADWVAYCDQVGAAHGLSMEMPGN